ncbi:MAG: sugar ABC transporter substrate-binding protein [Anaerolineaceae bacterium]|nr:MAG: sugar ABC transporter substrate-binding protein [Anaerolineaceae bacterium]
MMLVIALVLITSMVLAACSAPEQKGKNDNKVEDTKKNETKKDDTKKVDEKSSEPKVVTEIPVTGIGAVVKTDVKATGTYKIGFIAKNTTNPYMISQSQGVMKAGEVMGFEAVTQAPATADSVEEQVKIMEDMIQQGMNAIIVHCADSNGIMPGVRKAEEAGILVLTIGTPAAEDTFLRTGVNYKETGEVIAEEIAKALDYKGNVIILEGPPGAANAIERLNGINSVFDQYPDINVVASQTANFKRTEGMQVTENLIQKHTDVNAIIGMNDESALGAVQALKAAGMDNVLVGGFDGSADATSAVESGDMYVTYNTDPYGSGFVAAAYAVLNLNDGSVPTSAFVPFPSAADQPLINADTVAEYKDSIAWWKIVQ